MSGKVGFGGRRRRKPDPTRVGAQQLTWPKVGEEVEIFDRHGSPYDPMTVEAPCDDSHGGHWYCLAHREHFENQFDKDAHIHCGQHRLVWMCHKHGPEVGEGWK